MNIAHAIILGIVEGLTEFIPVSSTGHLIITSHILGLEQTEFLKFFEIVIQLGALFAIVPFFIKEVKTDWRIIYKIIAAFIPTAIIGLLFYEKIKVLLESPLTVIVSLFVGGVALIVIECFFLRKTKIDPSQNTDKKITFMQSIFLGLFQTLAFIPGASRSGATIVGGLLMGIPRAQIVSFTFLLALPTIAAASGFDLLKSNIVWTSNEIMLLVTGLVTSFVFAYISMKWFMSYMTKRTFIAFGIYRIIAAMVFFYILF